MRACNGLKPPDITSRAGRANNDFKRVVDLVVIVAFHYHIVHGGETLAGKFIGAGLRASLFNQKPRYSFLHAGQNCSPLNPQSARICLFYAAWTMSEMASMLLSCRLEIPKLAKLKSALELRSIAEWLSQLRERGARKDCHP